MNKVELIGTLRTIHPPVKFIKAGKDYEYVTILVELNDNRKVAVNVWNDKIKALDQFKAGELVLVDINIASEPNTKQGDGVYFHKLNLKTITHYDETIFRQP